METSYLGLSYLGSFTFSTLSDCRSLYCSHLLQKEVCLVMAEQDTHTIIISELCLSVCLVELEQHFLRIPFAV